MPITSTQEGQRQVVARCPAGELITSDSLRGPVLKIKDRKREETLSHKT